MTEEQEKVTQAQTLCERAREMLQREDPDLPQAAESLRQALDTLPDPPTTKSREIQDEAADLWRDLVLGVEDLHQADTYLREGAHRFDTHEARITFQRMRARVQSALATQEALELPTGRTWPAWFEDRQGKSRLSELLSTLDALLEEKSWSLLVTHARRLREALCTDMLPPFLLQIAESAYQLARERDFARAQQRINAASDFVPQTHLHCLPDTVDREAMLALHRAIDARQQVEVDIWTRLVRLTTQEASFQIAFQDFQPDLPDHPDVWVGDLDSLIADFTHAAAVEAALDPVSTGKDTFIDPSQWEKMIRTEFAIQEEVPAFLASTDPQLVSDLQSRLTELERRIQRAPEEIITSAEGKLEHEHPKELIEAAPELITRYWQVIWWLDKGMLRESAHVEAGWAALEQARDSLSTLAAYARDLFVEMKNQDDLVEVVDTLRALQELNQDLAPFPEKTGGSLPESLPEDAIFPEMDPVLASGALETWYGTLLTWMNITGGKAAPETTENRQRITEDVAQILGDLGVLREEVWPSLDLSPWEPGSTPAKIETEGRLILALVEALEAINEQVANLSSFEGATLLEERLEASGYLQQPHEVWILLPYHAVLLTSIQRIRQEFEVGIDAQIAEILNDHDRAPGRLQEDILARAKSPELSELVYYQIKSYAAEMAESSQNGARPETLPLWAAIRQATQPWADTGEELLDIPQESAERWRQLHREANWEYWKGWASSKRVEIAAGTGVLILIIVIAFVISPLLGRSRDRPQPTLIEALPSPISTIQLSAGGGNETARAIDQGSTATDQAGVCLDQSDYDFTLLEGTEFTPPRGTYFVTGTTPYPVTVAWQVRNSGICAWEQVAIEAQSSDREIDYEIRRAPDSAPISADEQVGIDEVVTIVLRFDVQEVPNLSGETWTLVANGFSLPGSAPLSFDPQDWIIPVTPPPSRP